MAWEPGEIMGVMMTVEVEWVVAILEDSTTVEWGTEVEEATTTIGEMAGMNRVNKQTPWQLSSVACQPTVSFMFLILAEFMHPV